MKYHKDRDGKIQLGDHNNQSMASGSIYVSSQHTIDGVPITESQPILSPTELEYFIELFKNPAALEADHFENLEEIYQKARLMLRLLMSELLLSDQFYKVDQ